MSVFVMRGLLWYLSRGPLAALARSKLRARKRADHGIFRVLSTSFDVVGRGVSGVDTHPDELTRFHRFVDERRRGRARQAIAP